MTDYIISQAIVISLLIAWGGFLMCRYHMRLSRPAKLRDFQFRIFAIRDSVVRLVADGDVSEDNGDWKELYEIVNESAKVAMVKKYGFAYVVSFIRDVEPPSEERIQQFESLPDPIRKEWASFAKTVLDICWDGSFALRMSVRIGRAIAFVHSLQQKHWKRESANIQQWKHVSYASGGSYTSGFSPWTTANC
jgi:hypothetical protein